MLQGPGLLICEGNQIGLRAVVNVARQRFLYRASMVAPKVSSWDFTPLEVLSADEVDVRPVPHYALPTVATAFFASSVLTARSYVSAFAASVSLPCTAKARPRKS